MAGIECGGCGMPLDEESGLEPNERTPCSSCGSLSRRISMQVTSSIEISATVAMTQMSDSLQAIATVSDLLLQTVVTFGPKTGDGRLIEAVTLPWFDIIAHLNADPHIAYQIPPDRWEEIIAGAYQKAGFDEVILTPRSGDLGRDVIATIRGIGSVRVIDQVKAYKPGHLVTADDVRALYGVLQLDGAAKGFLTTTSDFAPRLASDRLLAPIIPSRIELINGTTLLMKLDELAKKTKKQA